MSTIETNYPVQYRGTCEAILELSGDVTYKQSELIEADFLTLSCNGVSVLSFDFSKVRYMNSTGIAILIKLIHLSRSNHVELKAYGLSSHYQEIFKITRLGDYITVNL